MNYMYYFRFNPLDNLFIFMILKTVLSFSCRMSDFKTMTFEFENPRERVIRFFIGANGVNINKVKDELRMVSVENMHGFFFGGGGAPKNLIIKNCIQNKAN